MVSVGGGGLLNGMVRGMEEAGWTDATDATGPDCGVQLIAVETQGADSLYLSVQRREHITLPTIQSRATSLGATRVSDQSYEYACSRPWLRSVVVTDGQAARAAVHVADHVRLLVELACGASVAVCFDGILERVLERRLRPEYTVVVVLCGRSNVSTDMVSEWRSWD